MDAVATAANSVVQHSTSALQVAAGELARQAHSVAQVVSAKEAIAWLAGEDEGGGDAADGRDEERPPPLVPVPLAALRPWDSGWGMNLSMTVEGRGTPAPGQRLPPFGVDTELNAKVFLWEGNACSLEVDALLTPSAAGFASGVSTTFPKVLRHGGRQLRADLRHLDTCRSGEARITKAYGLPCSWLLLTIGPKYKDKYIIAAQNTLNACYRESMQLLVEAELRTVAIPCAWYHKGYPPEDQAQVALRSVRKCLEKLRHAIDAVVFVAANEQEMELYDGLMPLYFPRSLGEAEAGVSLLPDCCWTEWGEVDVEERKIRVSSHLISKADEGDDVDRAPLFSTGDDTDRSFLQARDDADTAALRRLAGTMVEAETPDLAGQACLRYLRRAREVRPEPAATRFVFRAGMDRYGRRVVVLLGARLPSLGVRDERTLPLFVKELELLRGERFVLLYANSNVASLEYSILEVLQEMLLVIQAKYRNSLDQLLVLHPGLWFRAAFALGRAVSDPAASVWHDTVYFEGLADLSAVLPVEQLDLPEYVRVCEAGG